MAKHTVLKLEDVMLKAEDIEYLKSLGYLSSDMRQIQEAIICSRYTDIQRDGKDEREITIKEALNKLDRKAFLSGIARSAFHYSAVRNYGDKRMIYFDSSVLFK